MDDEKNIPPKKFGEQAEDLIKKIQKLEQENALQKQTLEALRQSMAEILEGKQSERIIRESEQRFRAVFENSAVAITVADEHERIVSWNKTTESLFGMSRDDLYLRPVQSLYPPEDVERFSSLNIRKEGQRKILEVRILTKDGRKVDVEISVSALKDDQGRTTGSIGVIRDITEQKRVEEALQTAKTLAESAVRVKSEFLATMSHEIRTPMNAVIGFTDLLKRTDLDDVQKKYADMIYQSGEYLLEIINDILDISKIEARRIKMEEVSFDMEHLVASVLQISKIKLKTGDVELSYDYGRNIPRNFLGDPTRIRQIFLNLISNAIKFTEKGSIAIRVKRVETDEKDAEHPVCTLCVSVEDTGIGIPRNKQGLIFQVFTQADSTTTREYGGTGLGLAITKNLVEMAGGIIKVESEEGKGSKFIFTLRLKLAPPVVEQAIRPALFTALTGKEELSCQGVKILVVEDNVVNQKLMAALLKILGCDFEMVANGEDALQKIRGEKYDACFMDLHLPKMGGLEASTLIRRELQNLIPIIVLTADARNEIKEKCLEAGVNDFLFKPVDLKKVEEMIRKWAPRSAPGGA